MPEVDLPGAADCQLHALQYSTMRPYPLFSGNASRRPMLLFVYEKRSPSCDGARLHAKRRVAYEAVFQRRVLPIAQRARLEQKIPQVEQTKGITQMPSTPVVSSRRPICAVLSIASHMCVFHNLQRRPRDLRAGSDCASQQTNSRGNSSSLVAVAPRS